jgi:hypothetical protein
MKITNESETNMCKVTYGKQVENVALVDFKANHSGQNVLSVPEVELSNKSLPIFSMTLGSVRPSHPKKRLAPRKAHTNKVLIRMKSHYM